MAFVLDASITACWAFQDEDHPDADLRYRSHAGTHLVENLEPVCWDCHRVIRETERSE